MAYTYEQLTKAYTAVHGVEPTGEAASQLRLLTNVSYTDTQRLSWILNSADTSTSVAVLSYQFFTGKAPSAEGMDYLLKSGEKNLNSETYAKFNLENRFMNFATNLALQGEGKAAFEANYGSMTYAQYVASIYESIIGKAQATAAGLNPEQTILDIIGRQDLILQSARNNGVIGPNATAAEIDLALKADVGVYAGATNNFMVGVATGKAAYGTDILTTHAPTPGSDSSGVGNTIDNPPAFEDLPGAPPPPAEPEAPSNRTFTLTTGDDEFTGGAGNDTFTGTNLTFKNGDHLDGGAGDDTLTVTVTDGTLYTTPNNGATNIETVNIDSNGALRVNSHQWNGTTQLNLVSVGETWVSARTETNIKATVSDQVDKDITVYGGGNVTVDATGATLGAIRVGDSGNEPIGDIVIKRQLTGPFTGGNIATTGGKTVSITQTAIDPMTGVQRNGAVNVLGSTLTTEVTVKAAQTFNDGGASRIANTVAIADVNYGSASLAGTISKVSVDSYTSLAFNGSGLTDLSLAHGSGNVTLRKGNLLAPTNTTLNLALNGLTGGTLHDFASQYDTLNITTGAEASTLANLTFGQVQTLNLDGASSLTLPNLSGTNALQTIKITGAAGLTADVTGAAVALIDATGTTGNNTLTIDSHNAYFDGGAGVDTITLAATGMTHDITLGDGDDWLDVSAATSLNATIDGGAGVDTLIIAADHASLVGGPVSVSGFEIVELTDAAAQAIDLSAFGSGLTTVRTQGGAGLTLDNYNVDTTLELTGAGTAYTLTGAWSGGSDTLNLKLSDGSGAGVAFGSITSSGIETVNIVNDDTRATPTSTFKNALTLASDVKAVTITGDAGLTLISSSSQLTSVDASGLTGDFTFTSAGLLNRLTLTGTTAGTNTLNLGNVHNGVTYVGGSGSDTLTLAAGQNTIDLGSGADHVTFTRAPSPVATGYAVITGFGTDDKLTFNLSGGNTPATLEQMGAQATLEDYLNAAVAGAGNTKLQWFHFGTDTYLVQDRSALGQPAGGLDMFVKLTGVVDLADAQWALTAGTLAYGGSI